jgi:hypothetical protein
MSYTPQSPQAAPPRKRSLIPYLAAGCAVLGLCVICAALFGGGYFFYTQRSVTTVSAPSVEYILDATQRMSQLAEGENDTRLNVARGVLAEIVRPSDPAVTAGLRVFGSGAQPAACSDTALLVPLAPASQPRISTHLLSITNGVNPDAAMSQAMISAIRDLAALKGKHTLVVVTGGADSCTPQAGDLIAAEARKAGIDLKLFMIGYQVPDSDGNAIKGLVDSAGGNYINADNKEKLTEVISAIQQYVQDQKATTVTNVMGTAVAAVGTQNVIVAGTQPATGTAIPNNAATPAANSTPGPSTTPPAGATTAPTQGGVAIGTGQTACDHPYFPMRPGSTWTFSTDNGPMTWTVSGVTGDQTEATAVMNFTESSVSGIYNWHCTAEGIQSYDFGSLAGTGGTANIKVTQHSGTWLPPVDKLVAGATWDNSYTFEATDSSGGTSISLTETFNQHFTLTGTEQHDVAGQSMEALHIDTTGTVQVQASTGTTTINTTATYLLVRGVGPVLLTSQFQTYKSSSTLTSYSIP